LKFIHFNIEILCLYLLEDTTELSPPGLVSKGKQNKT